MTPLSKARDAERKRLSRRVQPETPNVQPKDDALQSTTSPVKEEANTILPLYNRHKHKQGDKVRMAGPVGKIIEVTVPELDAEGNPI